MHPIKNKKAYFDYEILDTFEAGIVLRGEEIKAVRFQGMDLSGSYVLLKNNRLMLTGATIPRYKHSNNQHYNSRADRLLLLRMSELERISKQLHTKGITLLALEGYFSHGLFKIKIGLGRGKKKYDKRESIKNRETERQVRREGSYRR